MGIFEVFVWSILSASASALTAAAPSATVDVGVVFGKTTDLPFALGRVDQYLGVPFAVTPPQRFAPPQPAPHSNERINATKWKPACIQQFRYPLASSQLSQQVFNNPPPREAEDCLYLNVYAPSSSHEGAGKPVMFWIYGGSLAFGNAGQSAYDGSTFAGYEDVIVVSANYRTNVFGFPGSPELPINGRNLGFLDQRLALDWVQRNIRAFGGDPDKVTIFGESAGAYSIDALLTSYAKTSKPPFRAAILQSGQYTYRSSPAASTFPTWNVLTAKLGCPGTFSSNLTCVRAATATKIQEIINVNSLVFGPTADNVTLVSDPARRRLAGEIARIPVLGGTNSQEGRIFTIGQNNLTQYLQATFGNGAAASLIPQIIAAYPRDRSSLRTDYDIIAQVYTDLVFQCPQAYWAEASAVAQIPTWRYYFNATFSNTQALPGLGAFHASEIPLVFRNYPTPNTTTQEYALAAYIQSTWARFARNPYAGPGWNPVSTGNESAILVGAYDQERGGVLFDAGANPTRGSYNLAVLGDVGHVRGSGATILSSREIDQRCKLYRPIYAAVVGEKGLPPQV